MIISFLNPLHYDKKLSYGQISGFNYNVKSRTPYLKIHRSQTIIIFKQFS